jgi:prepilin-type N-terminal cleavage/methylation domain-containing protein
MYFIRVKKRGFTLIELIVVILLITVTYFLIFSNSNFQIKKNEIKLSLDNLQEVLIKDFQFEQEIAFICIEENFECFIKIDGVLNQKAIIKNFFKNKPSVYEYNKEQKMLEFRQVNINSSNQDIIFELKVNSDYKINEFILDTDEEKVYVFNSIYKEPMIFTSLNEVLDLLENNELEVRDAF